MVRCPTVCQSVPFACCSSCVAAFAAVGSVGGRYQSTAAQRHCSSTGQQNGVHQQMTVVPYNNNDRLTAFDPGQPG